MTEITKKRKAPLWGILMQIPIWIFALLGIFRIFSTVVLSFTSYNAIELPKFAGLENYNLSDEIIVRLAIKHTVQFVIVTAILLIITAVIPAIFTARLKLPFGIAVMAGYAIVSFTAAMPSAYRYIYSDDSYGFINSVLLGSKIISEPIPFSQQEANILALIQLYAMCLAAVFAIAYIGARLKKTAIGSAIALCSIPVLMTVFSGYTRNLVGYPSADYSADWLPNIIYDYAKIRFEIGFASALTVIGLGMLLVWCAAVCGAVFGIYKLCCIIKLSDTPIKIIGFITFSIAVAHIINLIIPLFLCVQNSLKPLDEFFVLPSSIFALKPTLKNFSDLVTFYGTSSYWNFSKSISAIGFLFLVYIFAILPCSAGLVLTESSHRRLLLLSPLIALPALSPAFQLNSRASILHIYGLVSGIGCAVLIFVSYLVIKIMIYPSESKIIRLILGIACLITSFICVGLATVNFSTETGYDIVNNSIYMMNAQLTSGGIARMGMASAADVLLGLLTAVTAIVPVTLLAVLYILYRKAQKSQNMQK